MTIDRRVPLAALRAFEAAARHLSFTRAGEELFVTQAAVSHQIRRLEDYLGVRLFKRLNRALLLTDEGQTLLTPVREAFAQMDDAVARVRGGLNDNRLTISVLPSLAARWLVPRLGSFIQRYPDIDLRLAPSTTLTDFERDGVDAVIRYGTGQYPDLEVEWLMDEDQFPVCAPHLRGQHGPLEVPDDLARYTLLHDDDRTEWSMWLRLAGVEGADPQRGPVFTDSSMLIQAAATGQGVALARSVLAAQELADGRVVRLFERVLPSAYAYYLVYPPAHGHRASVQAFRTWLLEQREEKLGPSGA